MGRIIIRPKHSASTIGGYDIDFPIELNGILTLKEWDMLITIINQNMIRNHISIWFIAPLFILIGLIVFFIMAIVGIVRWEMFKSKAEDDLKKVLSSLNSQLCVKGVSITYHRSQACFTLEISYPDYLSKPINIANTFNASGFLSVLLDTYSGSIPLVNPDVHKQSYHPTDPRLRSLLISSEVTPLNYPGWKGFCNKSFPFALYNYLTPQEYKAVLDDYNAVLVSTSNSKSWNFFIASCFLCLILVGVLLIIPASIWLRVSRAKYRREFDTKLNRLNFKYNQMYSNRGISFNFYSTRFDLPRGYLNIFAPLDCGNGPTFSLLCTKKKVISATVPGVLQPMYINNPPLVSIPIQTSIPPNSGVPLSSIDIEIEVTATEKTPLIK
ncbi:hypothetical protein DICPUDRAFT_150542 [Dictyostelium purpureum]|uniref:Golgin subfamily A member 7/ERF4 domain-containing protein n=1 Tax=Dictyostelium purpureum TaxID=5786 RepID=F0ZGL0_DICPU|nr:uncharacterized protein DICPUDRAFT_150542 [Dictyostelium purpureum]EGC36906.1 hypothetical protein DICPUDRAFT_150542 [Dictyostelium purpureum]|eukprot:XP_003286549.1 hypothetical protein DICPUDRAFT_150542 [Dictyostelium purpureum]